MCLKKTLLKHSHTEPFVLSGAVFCYNNRGTKLKICPTWPFTEKVEGPLVHSAIHSFISSWNPSTNAELALTGLGPGQVLGMHTKRKA